MSFTLTTYLRSVFSPFSRRLHNRALIRPVPQQRGDIVTPDDFLKAIGRGSDTKISFDMWDALWKTDGRSLKQAGVAVRDRRYILWAMERYRQQGHPSDYAHEAKPKKKIRGHGPSVQFGKRIRSRRRQ
ncbi:IGR protein motif-domain-containing protein [Multifurca ochricompacta]|uniref:Small ribosomal subunit protein mS41 n=1 Tax=Multifurca ochricompacta TaxID=376703 RepID=A0AAD4M806_9AGAM|nr:IGR protein motif-domain-containing protein [Multifurca ochricompacta]